MGRINKIDIDDLGTDQMQDRINRRGDETAEQRNGETLTPQEARDRLGS